MSKLSEGYSGSALQTKPSSRGGCLGLENSTVRKSLSPVTTDLLSSLSPVVLRLSRQDQQNAIDPRNNQTPRRVQTPIAKGRKRKHRGASESSGSDIVCVGAPSSSNASSEIAESSQLQAQNARKLSRRQENMEPSSDPREEEFQPMQCELAQDSRRLSRISSLPSRCLRGMPDMWQVCRIPMYQQPYGWTGVWSQGDLQNQESFEFQRKGRVVEAPWQ
jgi:hypothetical protein